MGIKQVYTIGGNVCTLGGYAMGPTPPPPPVTLTLGGQPGKVSAYAAYTNASGQDYQLVATTDGTSVSYAIPNGSPVTARFSSAPYYAVSLPEVSGFSGLYSSETDNTSEGGTVLVVSGYMTADGLARESASAGAKTFTIYAVSGNTSTVLTGSGSGNGNRNGSTGKVRMPLRMTNTYTGEHFPSSCVVVRQTSELGATANVFEPIGCSAVGFSANIRHNPENASWSNPGMGTTYNFRWYAVHSYVEANEFASNGSGSASGTITAKPDQNFLNSLSSRTTADTALGFSSRYASEGSKTYGNFTVLGWTATGIAK